MSPDKLKVIADQLREAGFEEEARWIESPVSTRMAIATAVEADHQAANLAHSAWQSVRLQAALATQQALVRLSGIAQIDSQRSTTKEQE